MINAVDRHVIVGEVLLFDYSSVSGIVTIFGSRSVTLTIRVIAMSQVERVGFLIYPTIVLEVETRDLEMAQHFRVCVYRLYAAKPKEEEEHDSLGRCFTEQAARCHAVCVLWSSEEGQRFGEIDLGFVFFPDDLYESFATGKVLDAGTICVGPSRRPISLVVVASHEKHLDSQKIPVFVIVALVLEAVEICVFHDGDFSSKLVSTEIFEGRETVPSMGSHGSRSGGLVSGTHVCCSSQLSELDLEAWSVDTEVAVSREAQY